MKTIQLTKGEQAIVDDADYEWLSKFKWQCRANQFGTLYACRNSGNKYVAMHREILSAPSHLQVDHKNRNGLDNRRENLRLATASQNQANRPKQNIELRSPYKGINKIGNRWQARVKHMGKEIYIGLFKTQEEAAHAYDAKALEVFGEFAFTNFPRD